jgi:hypothetical protein
MLDNPWYIALYAMGLVLFYRLGASAASKQAKIHYEAHMSEVQKTLKQVHDIWTFVMTQSPEARRLAVNFHAFQTAKERDAAPANPVHAEDRVN